MEWWLGSLVIIHNSEDLTTDYSPDYERLRRKSRKTWGSSTCTGRGRGVVEFGSKCEYLFNNALAEGFLIDL